MTDFLSAFQRRESDSEGSEIDDDQPEFAHGIIFHISVKIFKRKFIIILMMKLK